MSFNTITEGSKEYIKYVLQLAEEAPSGVTLPDWGEPGRRKVPGTGKDSFTFSGGKGGRDLKGGDTTKPGDLVSNSKNKKGKRTDPGLQGNIMWGQSRIPGYVVKEKGEESLSDQGGLDYLTSLGQAQSSLEFADAMMPAAVKLLIAKGLYGSKVKASPDSKSTKSLSAALQAGMTGASSIQQAAGTAFQGIAGNLLDQIEKMTGAEGIANGNPLAQKVMQYSKNLGAIDPFNPLLGLKIGVGMLGGKEVLKRTRELADAQTAGAASTMGHPSGFRGY